MVAQLYWINYTLICTPFSPNAFTNVDSKCSPQRTRISKRVFVSLTYRDVVYLSSFTNTYILFFSHTRVDLFIHTLLYPFPKHVSCRYTTIGIGNLLEGVPKFSPWICRGKGGDHLIEIQPFRIRTPINHETSAVTMRSSTAVRCNTRVTEEVSWIGHYSHDRSDWCAGQSVSAFEHLLRPLLCIFLTERVCS